MAERRLDDAQLDAALTDLGRHVAYPPAPDVRARVLARIAEPRRAPWWRTVASSRYGLAPAVVTVALILVAVLVVSPEARATATDILRLRGVEIFRGPVPSPSPSRPPGASASPSFLDLGERVTLDEARRRAGFTVLVPSDPALGAPDEVYVRAITGGTQVAFVYRSRTGIPPSAQAGISALVIELGGRLDVAILGKVAGSGTRIEQLTVNGGPGAWLEGQPHEFFYLTAGGAFVNDSLRLAGNTLIWEQGGVVLRIEAQVDRATAVRLAGTMR
jgi:hypothetical protein